jgi:hypothetical protein
MYTGLAFLDDKYHCTSVLQPHGVLMEIIQANNRHNKATRLTFHTSRRSILQRVNGHSESTGPRWSIRDFSHLWSSLTEVAPFVRAGIAKAIGYSPIGAINDTGATGMFNSGDCFFILSIAKVKSVQIFDHLENTNRIDSLGKDPFRLVSSSLTKDLRRIRVRGR